MIVFRGLRGGGVAPAMSGHRQAAVTPSGGREKRPFGRPCRLLRCRRAALVMRPASRRTTLLAEKPARPSDVSPCYESKYEMAARACVVAACLRDPSSAVAALPPRRVAAGVLLPSPDLPPPAPPPDPSPDLPPPAEAGFAPVRRGRSGGAGAKAEGFGPQGEVVPACAKPMLRSRHASLAQRVGEGRRRAGRRRQVRA